MCACVCVWSALIEPGSVDYISPPEEMELINGRKQDTTIIERPNDRSPDVRDASRSTIRAERETESRRALVSSRLARVESRFARI